MSEKQSLINRLKEHVELCTAALLGLATLGAAYAAYQSALWNGNMIASYNSGIVKFGEANREYLRGSMDISFDTMIYLESLKELPQLADDVERMMSAEMRHAIKWADTNYRMKTAPEKMAEMASLQQQLENKWDEFESLEGKDADQERIMKEITELEGKVSYQTFLESPNYTQAKRMKGESITREAEKKMEEGARANQIGDTFTLVVVFFTVSLFFAGISSGLKKENIRLGMLGISAFIFLLSVVRMLLLPFA